MSKRSYSDKEKATALAALDANEGNVAKTAKTIGIPRKTLSEWAVDRFVNEDVAEIRLDKKKELADELEDLAYQLVGAIPRFVRSPFTKLQEVANTLGIAIEKCELLRGRPTGRTEIVPGENRQWAESQLLEVMREFNLSRDEALEQVKEHAPKVAEWIM